MRRVYMDANATTPLLPEVFEAMRPFWTEHFGNASSIHQQGQHARAAVEHARDSPSPACSTAAPAEIVFTSGGTESDNLALFGTVLDRRRPPHHHRHRAPRRPPRRRIARKARHRSHLPPLHPHGLIEPAALEAALRPNTRLVSIMLANNETGVIQPIARARPHRQRRTAPSSTPTPSRPPASSPRPAHGALKDVDLLTISGHKMYAPQGTGVLFVRRNVSLAPLFHGGTHERQRRAGTENVAGIVALGKAAELAATPGSSADRDTPATLAALRDRLEPGILARIPTAGINANAPGGLPATRVPNTTNLYFDHVEAEALVIALDLKGLSVSGGAPASPAPPSPPTSSPPWASRPRRARASIRFSLSRSPPPKKSTAPSTSSHRRRPPPRPLPRLYHANHRRITRNEIAAEATNSAVPTKPGSPCLALEHGVHANSERLQKVD